MAAESWAGSIQVQSRIRSEPQRGSAQDKLCQNYSTTTLSPAPAVLHFLQSLRAIGWSQLGAEEKLLKFSKPQLCVEPFTEAINVFSAAHAGTMVCLLLSCCRSMGASYIFLLTSCQGSIICSNITDSLWRFSLAELC